MRAWSNCLQLLLVVLLSALTCAVLTVQGLAGLTSPVLYRLLNF
jgi:hypothetical protein